MAQNRPAAARWLSGVLTTDFCPWANRFVYWLKEPVGWFVLATAVSVTIGLYFNPVGWTLAAALLAVIAVGMVWPLIAVHAAACALRPGAEATHEGDPCRLVFTARNRLPLPIWGLSVERYFDSAPTVALASVPPLCLAEFAIEVRPELRGRYPLGTPQVACSFPFGIWTARRPLKEVESLTVWPKVFPVLGDCPLVGRDVSDRGEGKRGGRSGDFVGVRAFRRGDSAKHIHWIASARTDELVVIERGGPQCSEVDLWLDTSEPDVESLAWRVRVAASLLLHLHSSRVPMRVRLGDRVVRFQNGAAGRRQLLDALAAVPLRGAGRGATAEPPAADPRCVAIRVSAGSGSADQGPADQGLVVVQVDDPYGGRRAGGSRRSVVLDPREEMAGQLVRFWREVSDGPIAA